MQERNHLIKPAKKITTRTRIYLLIVFADNDRNPEFQLALISVYRFLKRKT